MAASIRSRIAAIYPDSQISMRPRSWHKLRTRSKVKFAGSADCKIVAYCTDRRISGSDEPGEWYWVEMGYDKGGMLMKVLRKYLVT